MSKIPLDSPGQSGVPAKARADLEQIWKTTTDLETDLEKPEKFYPKYVSTLNLTKKKKK